MAKAKKIIRTKNDKPVKDKDALTKSELKWCEEANKRSDRSLLTTLYKMHNEPEKVREYHWIAYNEMCYRGIQDDPMPTKSAVASGAVVKAERLPSKPKDFGEDWKEGAVVVLQRKYGGQKDVEGIITVHWNEDFGYDFEVRIKEEIPGKPMHGTIFVNRDELELRNEQDTKKLPINWYIPPKPVVKDEIATGLEELANANKPKRKGHKVREARA